MNKTDRCDQCGAQAHALVASTQGLTLMFCEHHFREAWAGLIAQGFNVLEHTPITDKVLTTHGL